jgi:hypothetical protein
LKQFLGVGDAGLAPGVLAGVLAFRLGEPHADFAVVSVAAAEGAEWFSASAMGYAPALRSQAFCDFNIASPITVSEKVISTLGETHVCYEADTAVFVGEIWPDYIVEDVSSDGFNGLWKGGAAFSACGRLKGRCVDDEAGHVVQMRVGDEDGVDHLAEYISCVGLSGDVWDGKSSEGPRLNCGIFGSFVNGGEGHGLRQDFDYAREVGAGVDGENRAFRPFRSCGADEEAGDIVFGGATSRSLRERRGQHLN